MNQLKDNYIISEHVFYSNNKNINIELLCKLQKSNLFIIKQNEIILKNALIKL